MGPSERFRPEEDHGSFAPFVVERPLLELGGSESFLLATAFVPFIWNLPEAILFGLHRHGFLNGQKDGQAILNRAFHGDRDRHFGPAHPSNDSAHGCLIMAKSRNE